MTHLDHLAGRDAGASFPPALPALTRHHRLPQELTPAPTARSPRVPKSGFQLSFWGQGSSCQQYCGWQRGSRELKHPQNHPASPETPISSRDTLEHLSPGCPQVPAQVLMKFVAMLGEVRLPRRIGLPALLWGRGHAQGRDADKSPAEREERGSCSGAGARVWCSYPFPKAGQRPVAP